MHSRVGALRRPLGRAKLMLCPLFNGHTWVFNPGPFAYEADALPGVSQLAHTKQVDTGGLAARAVAPSLMGPPPGSAWPGRTPRRQ